MGGSSQLDVDPKNNKMIILFLKKKHMSGFCIISLTFNNALKVKL